MKVEIIEERWKKFENWSLKSGAHPPDSIFCVMEAVAYVAGEDWSDHPKCACPIISSFLRYWNDALPTDVERNRLLKSFIPRLINTRSTKEIELKRGLMAADWLIRIHTPAWLHLAGLTKQAEYLWLFPEITTMKKLTSLRRPFEAIKKDAAAAGAAALDAAWAAAGAAALDAAWAAARFAARAAAGAAALDAALDAARFAARAAAGAAALDAALDAAWAAAGAAALDAAWATAWAAALDAAWVAARDAARASARTAARDAARDAARVAAGVAAGAKLAPTQEILQESALKLLQRMIETR